MSMVINNEIYFEILIGLVKNQKLPQNILTPTTKAADHDEPITPEEVYLICLYVFLTSPPNIKH